MVAVKVKIMQPKRVYLESSVISYLTARPAKDMRRLVKQRITKEWWKRRDEYDLFISQTVVDEIGRGDAEAASLRLEAILGIPRLSHLEIVNALVHAFLLSEAVPSNYAEDAFHIAIAAVHQMDIILTWNQKHIANPRKLEAINSIIRGFHLTPLLVLTPEQLLEMESCDHETD
jgi:predicted nucleic acid-binding protein